MNAQGNNTALGPVVAHPFTGRPAECAGGVDAHQAAYRGHREQGGHDDGAHRAGDEQDPVRAEGRGGGARLHRQPGLAPGIMPPRVGDPGGIAQAPAGRPNSG
ncbi:hypothetical protein GCM10020295_71380 [Streptomyces cinereospinus]